MAVEAGVSHLGVEEEVELGVLVGQELLGAEVGGSPDGPCPHLPALHQFQIPTQILPFPIQRKQRRHFYASWYLHNIYLI